MKLLKIIAAAAFLVLLASPLGPKAFAEHTIGNGGGQGEQNFTYALVSFDRFALMCRAMATCAQSDAERALLQDISDHLRDVTESPTYLTYALSQDEPVLRGPDGTELPYATERRWGAPVIINRAKLYTHGSDGVELPVSVATAMTIAADVLLFQRSALNDEPRLALAARLSQVATTASEVVAIGHGSVFIDADKLIRFYAWRYALPDLSGPYTEVTIQDADQTYDITDSVRAALRCPTGRVPDTARMIVRDLAILNDTPSPVVGAEALYPCVDPTGAAAPASAAMNLRMTAGFAPQPDQPKAYVLVPGSVRVTAAL